jgi:hypothetical protein
MAAILHFAATFPSLIFIVSASQIIIILTLPHQKSYK